MPRYLRVLNSALVGAVRSSLSARPGTGIPDDPTTRGLTGPGACIDARCAPWKGVTNAIERKAVPGDRWHQRHRRDKSLGPGDRTSHRANGAMTSGRSTRYDTR